MVRNYDTQDLAIPPSVRFVVGVPSDNDVGNVVTSGGSSPEFQVGLTFWLGVVALVLALFASVCLLVTAKHAGKGPFACACCEDSGRANHAHVVYA